MVRVQPVKLRTGRALAAVTSMLLAACVACGGGGSLPGQADGGADVFRERPLVADDYVLTEGPETAGLAAVVSPEETPAAGESGGPSGSESTETERRITACLGVPADALGPRQLGAADSVIFKNGSETLTVRSSATIYSRDDLRKYASVVVDPDYMRCSNEAMVGSGLADSMSPGVEIPAPDGALGAFRMNVAVGDCTRPCAALDMIFFGHGRVAVSLLVLSLQGVPGADLEGRLARQIVRKLQNQ